ncbi:S-layer homology domain-containing protein [Paenibacillus sp. UNC496MF]|uniref:S-layer homology domain-containing protein n=1 Tax=Paenibacillus sp. UNC496MF TaxID=1502753 RepID=UPI0008F19C2A|nr:S-layer homology domain-containing protein [Paenibacillus sp. UNC496MF]SFJ64568.1 S-layer homology domain-containing protein [Paenibacillus sp. UNC496MF]
MIKKPLSATLSGLIVTSALLTSGIASADANASFTDINNSYAKDAIIELQTAGILTGVDATHFNPKGQLTRAEFVAIIVRSMGLKVDTTLTKSSFSDVKGWAVPYIEAAVEAGIISGVGNGKFDPSGVLTREQAAVILVKAIESQNPDLDTSHGALTFSDAGSISDWAKDYIAIAVKLGLIHGNADGTFGPKGNATREQAAVMSVNFIHKSQDIQEEGKPTTDPTDETTDPGTPPPVVTPPVYGGGGSTSDTSAPTLPQDVAVSDITTTSVKISWTASTDNVGVKSYTVFGNDKEYSTTETSIVIDGLDPNTDYEFYVQAFDAAGNHSGNTDPITAHTEALAPVAVTNVHIESSNADPSKATRNDTVTLTFNTSEEVSKLGNFKINGSNPADFTSVQSGDAWINTATYVLDGTDPIGDMTFQINVKNEAGTYSQTIESTTDGSSVSVYYDAVAISGVHIASSNVDPTQATIGDTVTLTFRTAEKVNKLSNFKINGSNPDSFASVADGDSFLNTATHVIDDGDQLGDFTFQINVKNEFGIYSQTVEVTNDGSSITVVAPPVVTPVVAINEVSIASNNEDPTIAKVGDKVTLTFTTNEEVFKLSNFKIGGNNPDSFVSEQTGDVWTNTATYTIQESDAVGIVSFQINVKNGAGIYSQTIEATSNGSTVTIEAPVVVAPVAVNEVHIESNSLAGMNFATVGDIVSLTFVTDEEVTKLSNFKINGGNPTSIVSEQRAADGKWVNVAYYVIDETDPLGVMTFQINVKNAAGIYSQTVETTYDGSSVTVQAPVVPAVAVNTVHIESNNANPTLAKEGDTVTLSFTTAEEVSKLGNFKVNGSNPDDFTSVANEDGSWMNTASYTIQASDPEGVVSFQINVKNGDGIYSQTIEASSDNSSVTVQKAPVISNVHIESSAPNPAKAQVGDTVTLVFNTNQQVTKLGNFKINGNNPTSFESVGEGNSWTNTATYVLDGTDPAGVMSFQINVMNAAGLYSVTTEATADDSAVAVVIATDYVQAQDFGYWADATPTSGAYNVGFKINTEQLPYDHITKIEVALVDDSGNVIASRTATGGQITKLALDDVAYGDLDGQLSAAFIYRDAEDMNDWWTSTAYDFTTPAKAVIMITDSEGTVYKVESGSPAGTSGAVSNPQDYLAAQDFGFYADAGGPGVDAYNVGFQLNLANISYDALKSIEVALVDENGIVLATRTASGSQIEQLKADDDLYGGLDGQLSAAFIQRDAAESNAWWTSSSYDFTTPTKAVITITDRTGRIFTVENTSLSSVAPDPVVTEPTPDPEVTEPAAPTDPAPDDEAPVDPAV